MISFKYCDGETKQESGAPGSVLSGALLQLPVISAPVLVFQTKTVNLLEGQGRRLVYVMYGDYTMCETRARTVMPIMG